MTSIVFPEETIVFFLWCFSLWMMCYSSKIVQVVLGVLFFPVFSLLLWNYLGWDAFSLSMIYLLFPASLELYGFFRILEVRG